MASRIEDYALLGDCHGAALVSRDGSVDWLCLPRFDSAALFAALLGDDGHGRWRIAPAEQHYRVHRRYLGDSMVLETTFETATGVCRLLDGMLLDRPGAALVRIVEGVRGEVALAMDLTIRFDYGSIVPWVRRTGPRRGSGWWWRTWTASPGMRRRRRGCSTFTTRCCPGAGG